MTEVVISGAARTPIGAFNGALSPGSIELVRRRRQRGRTGGLQHHVHLAAAAADLQAFRVLRTERRRLRAGFDAARFKQR